jgi:hypothetical protein
MQLVLVSLEQSLNFVRADFLTIVSKERRGIKQVAHRSAFGDAFQGHILDCGDPTH